PVRTGASGCKARMCPVPPPLCTPGSVPGSSGPFAGAPEGECLVGLETQETRPPVPAGSAAIFNPAAGGGWNGGEPERFFPDK
ncbi:MAG: hypothetical protein ACYDEZ_03030, partial [Methanoregula sp.]